MKLFDWPGAGFLIFMLCASVVTVGFLLLALLLSYLYLGAFVFGILSQGVGHG